MSVGVLLCAIAGGAAALAAALVYGTGVLHAMLSYPLGGMLAVVVCAVMNMRRQGASGF